MKLAVTLISLLVFLRPLGQTSTAAVGLAPNFSGTIVDMAAKARVPRAHVWIHGDHGDFSSETLSDNSGKFSASLPNGYFDVMIGAPGFQPVSRVIWVQPGSEIQWRVVLCADLENLQDTSEDPGRSLRQCSKTWSVPAKK